MRHLTKIVSSLSVSLLIGFSSLLNGVAQAAGTASLYLTPASGSVIKGKQLTLSVYEDSGSDSVNAVQANLTYPTSLLSYVSYSSGSAFTIEAENPSGNTGSLHFARATTTPKTGAQLIVTVTFKAVASSGTAVVSFDSGSAVVRSSDNGSETLTKTGGSYKLKAPASSSSSSSSSSHPPSSSSSSSSSSTSTKKPTKTTAKPAATKDTTPPKITGISISNISGTGATIQWKTSEPATSQVWYGLDTRHEIPTFDNNLVTNHKITLGSGLLVAGKTYHFMIKNVDAAGNKAASQDMTFSTVAPLPTKAAKSNSALISGIVIGSIVLVALATAGTYYKRRHASQEEINRHFPELPKSPGTGPAGTSSIINPGSTVTPPGNQPEEILPNKIRKGP